MRDFAALLSVRAIVALWVAVAAPLLALIDLSVPGRVMLAVAFFLLVPGVALVELLRLPSAHVAWCLAVGLSLAVNLLSAQAQLVLGRWNPLAGQVLIALVAIVLTGLAAWTGRPAAVADTDGADAAP